MVGYNFVSSQLKYSVHAVCVDTYLVLGCPDRQKSRVLHWMQTEEQKLGKLGEGLEDSDLVKNGLRF